MAPSALSDASVRLVNRWDWSARETGPAIFAVWLVFNGEIPLQCVLWTSKASTGCAIPESTSRRPVRASGQGARSHAMAAIMSPPGTRTRPRRGILPGPSRRNPLPPAVDGPGRVRAARSSVSLAPLEGRISFDAWPCGGSLDAAGRSG